MTAHRSEGLERQHARASLSSRPSPIRISDVSRGEDGCEALRSRRRTPATQSRTPDHSAGSCRRTNGPVACCSVSSAGIPFFRADGARLSLQWCVSCRLRDNGAVCARNRRGKRTDERSRVRTSVRTSIMKHWHARVLVNRASIGGITAGMSQELGTPCIKKQPCNYLLEAASPVARDSTEERGGREIRHNDLPSPTLISRLAPPLDAATLCPWRASRLQGTLPLNRPSGPDRTP